MKKGFSIANPIHAEFATHWDAQLLAERPLILPRRHFVYPLEVEEVERGALEVLITPRGAEPFLGTFALGFAGDAVPTGVWSCPNPDQLLAVAGGYAYIVNTSAPEQWEQVEYRPVVEIRALPEHGLLLFASFHSLLAYGSEGRRWKTGKLTSEGLRLGAVADGKLEGWGWEMLTDREVEFSIDLATGTHRGGVLS